MIDAIIELIFEGLIFLRNYAFYPSDGETFSLMRILSLLIAFSISGAIVVFMAQGAVLKHMGPDANKVKAFLVASVSGIILAVCSCSVLPMFASIRKKGAGLGPAIAFLFSGPAINVLALTLTFTDIGPSIALSRVIGAIVISLVIGFLMMIIFNKSEQLKEQSEPFKVAPTLVDVYPYQRVLFFLTLFLMLIFGVYRPIPTLILAVLLVVQLIVWFDLEDIKAWGYETFLLSKKILPLFIVGIFIAGILSSLITEDMLSEYVGNNQLSSNVLASLIGATMYFATLTEVPIIKTLIDNGMHSGPAVALLLAGPTLSIPNMIVIGKVLKPKKTFTYILLVVLLSSIIGLIAGMII